MIVCDECVECTEHCGYDVAYSMMCFMAGHKRLVIQEEDE